MDIYIPFTYIIGWSKHKKFYYGAKYAQGCQPSDLWESYFTSSEYVEDFRREFGEPDIIKIHRTFSNKDSCKIFESKFLKRIDAKNNDLFLNKHNGWGDYCQDDEQIIEKRKQTCLEKYGVRVASQSSVVKEKMKKTCLEKYGYESHNSCPNIKKKKEEVFLLKYGYKNVLASPEIQEKKKQTCLEKYGYENVAKLPEIQEKKKQTCLEKYGVECSSQSSEVKEKAKQTCLLEYGYENAAKSPKVKAKVVETNFKLYGFANYQQTPEARKMSSERAKNQREKEPQLTCPYCGLIGKGPNMKRYHFDKCKHKL